MAVLKSRAAVKQLKAIGVLDRFTGEPVDPVAYNQELHQAIAHYNTHKEGKPYFGKAPSTKGRKARAILGYRQAMRAQHAQQEPLRIHQDVDGAFLGILGADRVNEIFMQRIYRAPEDTEGAPVATPAPREGEETPAARQNTEEAANRPGLLDTVGSIWSDYKEILEEHTQEDLSDRKHLFAGYFADEALAYTYTNGINGIGAPELWLAANPQVHFGRPKMKEFLSVYVAELLKENQKAGGNFKVEDGESNWEGEWKISLDALNEATNRAVAGYKQVLVARRNQ